MMSTTEAVKKKPQEFSGGSAFWLLWLWLQMQRRFHPWRQNFCVGKKKKEKKEGKNERPTVFSPPRVQMFPGPAQGHRAILGMSTVPAELGKAGAAPQSWLSQRSEGWVSLTHSIGEIHMLHHPIKIMVKGLEN